MPLRAPWSPRPTPPATVAGSTLSVQIAELTSAATLTVAKLMRRPPRGLGSTTPPAESVVGDTRQGALMGNQLSDARHGNQLPDARLSERRSITTQHTEHLRRHLAVERNDDFDLYYFVLKGLSLLADSVDQLAQDFADYQTAVGDLFATVEGVLANLEAAVTAAQADPGKLSTLDAQVATAKQEVADEKAKVTAADPGPPKQGGTPGPTEPPAPAGGGAVTGDPGTGGTPAAPAAPSSGGTPATEMALYTYDGPDEASIDHNMWPESGFVTTDTPPRKLYHFSGDQNPGDKNGDGVGNVWHIYTGPTAPAGA